MFSATPGDGVDVTRPETHAIGVVGIGEMGFPIAKRYLNAGYDVTAFDINQGRLDRFEDLGGRAATSPADVADLSDSIHIVVVDDAQIEAVLFGTDGVIDGLDGEGTLLIHSTILPSTVREIAGRLPADIDLFDAAVSGGSGRAASGELAMMVGGPEPVVAALRPVLEPIARRVFHLGDVGTGMAAKLTNNAILYANVAATLEALSIGEAYGIARTDLLDVYREGTGDSFFIRNYDHFTLDRLYDEDSGTYRPAEEGVRMGKKDLNSMLTMAADADVSVPVGAVVSQRYPETLRACIETRLDETGSDDRSG
jgi:3-hydroxyisobutyrate dehydrogenase-like beta-hydroxyacid dehydrogenase